MIRAELVVKVTSRLASRSLVRAVAPDNVNLPGLRVVSSLPSRSVGFKVTFEGKIETFISSLDDMLRCLQAAKGTLDTITEGKME